jgi:hypothetical protein
MPESTEEGWRIPIPTRELTVVLDEVVIAHGDAHTLLC